MELLSWKKDGKRVLGTNVRTVDIMIVDVILDTSERMKWRKIKIGTLELFSIVKYLS